MTLKKADIIENVAKQGFTRNKSAEIVATVLKTIKASLENGEDVLISGLGKFCVKDKRKRKGRNPQTGDDLTLGARGIVTFRCSGGIEG